MWNKGLYILIIVLVSTTLISSCNYVEETKQVRKKNIIVLLDLSDRIIKDDQAINDAELIKFLYKNFLQRTRELIVKNNRDFSVARDIFQLRIANQINNPNSLREKYQEKLYKNLENLPKEKFNHLLNQSEEDFNLNLDELYKEAYQGNNPKNYFGADIFKYFNEELEKDLIHDSITDNYIFLLCDGYMFVSGIQGEDIPKSTVNKKYENVKVMMLEVTPKDQRRNEIIRLEEGWKKWFQEMNINEFAFEQRGTGITKTKENVFKFLNSEGYSTKGGSSIETAKTELVTNSHKEEKKIPVNPKKEQKEKESLPVVEKVESIKTKETNNTSVNRDDVKRRADLKIKENQKYFDEFERISKDPSASAIQKEIVGKELISRLKELKAIFKEQAEVFKNEISLINESIERINEK